jgi:signal transduction histidine kinase/CheY-like chemotaxis protein
MQQSPSLPEQNSQINGTSDRINNMLELAAQLWLEHSWNKLQNRLNDCLFSASATMQQGKTEELEIFQILVNELHYALCPDKVMIALINPGTNEGKVNYIYNPINPYQCKKHRDLEIALSEDKQFHLRFQDVLRLPDLLQLEKQQPQNAWRLIKDPTNLNAWLIITPSPNWAECSLRKNIPDKLKLQLIDRAIDYFGKILLQIRQMQFWQSECQKLARLNQELERNNQIKNQFLANTSHEIRTPLSLILGFTHLLQIQCYDPHKQKHQEYLSIIQSSGKHLLGLINDILDLAKIEAEQMDLQWEVIDVPVLCRNVIALVKEKATSKGLNLQIDLAPDVKTLVADSLRLKQMLLNLLFNAIKFTHEGSVGLRVNVKDIYLRFTVWDTGLGISPDDQALLFQPYQRIIHHSDDHNDEGTGLGLAVTKKLVQMHNGFLTLESQINHGSSFTIALPLNNSEKILSITETLTGDSTINEPGSPCILANIVDMDIAPESEVLLVENNLPHTELIQIYLQRLGYKVTCATNAASMWIALAQKPPVVILMDVSLPDANGLELVKQLRANQQYCHIPIIAQTSMAMKGDRELCLAAGMNDYISKPIDLPLLAKMVAKYSQFLAN